MPDATMPKTWNFQEAEEPIYAWWERNGFFRPEQQIDSGLADPDAKPFVISMPPPNVTGILHLGHAMTNFVEDALIRWNRMLGRPTLWVPGSDHAGIATQNVVERALARKGITRHDLGREGFVEEVWKWKAEYHAAITLQMRRMGISCDWERERFTLDEGLSEAVLEAFIRLYDAGLIYRGNRLVNWCPRCLSAISDLEVDYEEEAGRFYTFRYPLAEGGFIDVSTTRPETILGDTAVAVHPEDERYAHLVGKTALVPILNRQIPVIADAHVERDFGTGALKVTPGHDFNDYEIGLRHGLPMLNIFNLDATVNESGGPYAGLARMDARARLWSDMADAGLVVKDEERPHQVGHCQRCNTIVEPLLSEQWWVKTKPLAEPAMEAVRDGTIRMVPQRFEKTWFHWMENIRDWCISRQLWWGHRIPVWYGPEGSHFVARNEAEALARAEAHFGRAVELSQDPDVLDTWFSSGLWPFSTLGWPQLTEDLARYYPTSVLETGYDILFFWVARMVMLGMRFTGQVPFDTVYLHGIIRDETGRKMSKTLGNALDPLELIRDYGADALRFTLLTTSTPGNDMKLALTRVEGNRNFANKIWNAARFVIGNLEESDLPLTGAGPDLTFALPDATALNLADRWILARLQRVTHEATRLCTDYQLGEAGRQLYEFLWGDYCDWYIEAAKVSLYEGRPEHAQATRQVAAHVLERSLRLLHPFMPYVTESIWQNLPGMASPAGSEAPVRALMTARMPVANEFMAALNFPAVGADSATLRPSAFDGEAADALQPWTLPPALARAEDDFGRLQEVVRAVRNARSEYAVAPGKRFPAHISAGGHAAVLADNLPLLASLARIDAAATLIAAELPAPAQAVTLAVSGATVYLPLSGLVDFAAERVRLRNEIAGLQAQVEKVEALLGNEGFTAKAPANVIVRERGRLEEMRARRDQLAERLALLAE